jgi:hypothetical protein
MTQPYPAAQSRVPIGDTAAIEQGLPNTPYFSSVACLARLLGGGLRAPAAWLNDAGAGAGAYAFDP